MQKISCVHPAPPLLPPQRHCMHQTTQKAQLNRSSDISGVM